MKRLKGFIYFALVALSIAPSSFPLEAQNPAPAMKFPQVSPGTIRRHVVYSPQLADNYTVDVWFPEGYDKNREKKYPVIYAQDGQNLYDPKENWINQTWDMDAMISKLGDKIETPIVVGIRNNPSRCADYMPQAPLANLPNLAERLMRGWGQQEVKGDRYLDFMVNTVKPLMEENYNIRTDADGVIALGSSMGGLISMYAMCEYPDVFGTALCLSTHWLGCDQTTSPEFPNAMLAYLEEKLPSAENHKLYLDHGTKGFDAYYEPWNGRAYNIAVEKGYEPDKTVMAYTAQGADHNEYFWSLRLDKPLLFALEVKPQEEEEDNVGIEDIFFDVEKDGPTAIYTLDGLYMGTEKTSLPSGVYIVSKGGKTLKVGI